MQLPPPFEDQMRVLLGEEAYSAFTAALETPPPVSIRVNPLKMPTGTAAFYPDRSPVPWHPAGFYLPERPVFTLDPLLHAGAYYVQEASSMFLQEILRQLVPVDHTLKVLDLCAAPGGKSTLLLAGLPNSLVVSNEVIRSRVGPLRENLERWGHPNTAVTSAEAEAFGPLEGWFDLVVTDAPCSGEGLFRKDPDAIQEWSPENVALCAARQKRILGSVYSALKPGGTMIYSTCTYNHQENDANVQWLQQNFGMQPHRLKVPAEWGITETATGYQFYPHRLRGEGLFVAVLKKEAGEPPRDHSPSGYRSLQPVPKKQLAALTPWFRPDPELLFFQTPGGEILALPAAIEPWYRNLDKALRNKWFGTVGGTFKGHDFIPAHALALSTLVAPNLPHVDLDQDQALRFLRKETFDLPPGAPAKGWALARYQGLNLGWLKIISGRWNNYLPNDRRIRMDIR